MIKPYPDPKENKIKGATSRFTIEFKKFKDGTEEELFGKAEFKSLITEFEYDADNKKVSFVPSKKGEIRKDKVQAYIPNLDLIALVKLAQVIQRPILLKGEPGCGKTQLAKSVAYEWYGENYREHFFEWHIKSTSKAVDGLYKFDHLKRLREAHLEKHNHSHDDGALNRVPNQESEDLKEFREFGPLAKAFLTSKPDAPSIILIDEIDKADIDFPNDLLLELDENRFTIPETKEVIYAVHPPLVFITSNDERDMPEAFLRRCLFMYLRFPERTLLEKIIKAHLPGLIEEHDDFVDAAIKRFDKLKKDIDDDVSDNKRVSTSELLDWLKAYRQELADGAVSSEHLSADKLETLPLYYQALLKTYEGLRRENKLSKNE